jgi:hypothetical protein
MGASCWDGGTRQGGEARSGKWDGKGNDKDKGKGNDKDKGKGNDKGKGKGNDNDKVNYPTQATEAWIDGHPQS